MSVRTKPAPTPDLRAVLQSGKWDVPTIRDLARWIEATDRYLRSLPSMFIDEVEFVAGTTPTKRIDTSITPRGIVPLAFDNVTTKASAQAASVLRWSFSQGIVTFTSFAGIAGTDTYRFRFLVVEA